MNIHPYTWIVTIVILVGVLLVDAVVIGRRPHVPTTKECLKYIGLYVALALLFGLGIWVFSGARYSMEFYSGWLTEYSLSLDNLFIFLIIMEKQRVPRQAQQFALLVGIMLSLLLRGAFIALGKVVIEEFAWVFYLFGLWVLRAAWGVISDFVRRDEASEKAGDSRVAQFVKSRLPTTDTFEGDRIVVRGDDGRRRFTLIFFTIVALGTTDVMFALDSIPAIYSLTVEPYIVFTANVFALMGLRQLYFVLGTLLEKLYYLPVGLTVLLTFIGVKLILHAMHHYGLDAKLGFSGEISTTVSLMVIVAILGLTAAASFVKTRREAAIAAANQ